MPTTIEQAVEAQTAGKLEEAEALYRAILKDQPKHPDANHNLGVLAVSVNKPADALPLLRTALEANPNQGQYWLSYIDALIKDNQPETARVVLEQGKKMGLSAEQVDALSQRLASRSEEPESDKAQSLTFTQQRKKFSAKKEKKKNVSSSQRSPGHAGGPSQGEVNDLLTQYQSGQYEVAEKLAISMTQKHPNHQFAWKVLGAVLRTSGRLHDAVVANQKAVALAPNDVEAHSNLGNALKDLSRPEEAEASFRQAITLKPDFAEAHSNLLFLRSHMPTIGEEQLYEAHCEFGRVFEAPVRFSWPLHTNGKDPTRTLRIGLVSGDLRAHAVASFIEPILRHLSTYEGLTLHAYYNYHSVDLVSKRLQEYFVSWSQVRPLLDADLAEKICSDGIDILIDLSGHTAYNRLPVFARKPAPLQASWIGYPGTTGLESMDYFFCDKRWLPQGQFASQFTEKLAYLPATAAFQPETTAPAVSELPALHNGYVTFGSFNRMDKVNRATIQIWAQVLRAVPDARMLLGNVTGDENKQRVIDWFEHAGVALERLDLRPRSDMATYLALHSEVDVCLDTLPYGGGTTVYHALWMGVPTVTLAGSTPASRQATYILGSCGLDSFVCDDAEDFVRKSILTASSVEVLSTIRAGMRERVLTSPLGQPALVAKGLERALRMMWERWCAELPAQSLDVAYLGASSS